ncbi:MAG: methylated-DNA--[protein]-cysteine S-methyltransferase [Gemmatimonadetes bacterium]|nr:MAG: methylated-DNA--[protein]-cysteine S-methyltransferase [Gemmatimonadota bacterium]
MDATYKTYYASPIGLIELEGNEYALQALNFVQSKYVDHTQQHPSLEPYVLQLDEYFQGKRREFEMNLVLNGTKFQQKVWEIVRQIPYGETRTYKDIALQFGNLKAIRAVGAANGKNKISIVIPCHRVIGSNGKLTGYAGGLWRKEWLLRHEGALLI